MSSDLISKSELIERLEHLREVLLDDNDTDSDLIAGVIEQMIEMHIKPLPIKRKYNKTRPYRHGGKKC